MLAPTQADLIRELAQRMGEYVASTPTAAGTTTTLIDSALKQYWPLDVAQHYAWVYGAATADTNNRTIERRVQSWDADSTTLTFLAAWPTAPTTGLYEVHTRTPRARKLRALNAAIGELHLYWYRPFVDESLTTASNTYTYSLPSNIIWAAVPRLEIQVNTAVASHPYSDASVYNPQIRRSTTTGGVTTWTIQFGRLPPPGRKLRVYGMAAYGDLASDTAVLGLQESWASAAQEWIYEWAEFKLWSWDLAAQPASQTEKLRIQRQEALMIAKRDLLDKAPVPQNSQIIVPGHGDGQWAALLDDPRYLGGFAQVV